jgi:hypothetical protein
MSGYGMVKAAVNATGGRTESGRISVGGTARNLGSILRQQMPDRRGQARGDSLLGNKNKRE